MNISIVAKILGKVIMCEGALLLLPYLTAILYNEYTVANVFALTILICVVIAIPLLFIKPKNDTMRIREGYAITALAWIVMSIFGAIPFMLTGAISDPISALFETVSGFTTTGASVISDVEALPKGLLFWRSFTHWIGGMGVLVFILTLTNLKGGSNTNLMKAESTGAQVEKLVPRLQSTAKILYGIYIAMTLIQIVFLLAGGMSVFESVTIAFGTAGTGGFGVKNDSLASYSPYLQNVVSIFMILFGISFSFYFLLLKGKIRRAAAMEEVKWYLVVIITAIVIISVNCRNYFESIGETVRYALFQVSSIITTTGYATTDFNLWPQLSRTILVLLMFVGACAGSTGGGIKVSRFLVLFKTVKKELKNYVHPQGVSKIKMDGKTVPHEVVRSINVFMVAYVLIYALSLLLITFDNHDLVTNFTAVVASLNNIGPGLEMVGPTSNFSIFSNGAKIVLIFDMLIGRLEIFPILLLFTRDTWRKV